MSGDDVLVRIHFDHAAMGWVADIASAEVNDLVHELQARVRELEAEVRKFAETGVRAEKERDEVRSVLHRIRFAVGAAVDDEALVRMVREGAEGRPALLHHMASLEEAIVELKAERDGLQRFVKGVAAAQGGATLEEERIALRALARMELGIPHRPMEGNEDCPHGHQRRTCGWCDAIAERDGLQRAKAALREVVHERDRLRSAIIEATLIAGAENMDERKWLLLLGRLNDALGAGAEGTSDD